MVLKTGKMCSKIIPVPTALLADYQARIGAEGVLVWLNVRWYLLLKKEEEEIDIQEIQNRTGLSPEQWEQGLSALEQTGLVEIQREGFAVPQLVLNDPEDSAEGAEEAVAAAQAQEPVVCDLETVFQAYHDTIGLMAPTDFLKLRSWVEDRGLTPGVLVAGIRETGKSATFRRMSYLEGILRNWYNDGIRNEADLSRVREEQEKQMREKTTSKPYPRGADNDMANGVAYKKVNAEEIKRWKELYPDEYPD